MIKIVSQLVAVLFICLLVFSSCKNEVYDKANDELFLGISFGMERKPFFDTCWENNQRRLTDHGTINNEIVIVDSTRFNDLVDINFYPEFHDDKIYQMSMKYGYTAWAPWLKDRFSDSLIKEVKIAVEEEFNVQLKEKTVNNKIVYFLNNDPLIYALSIKDDRLVEFVITNRHYKNEE